MVEISKYILTISLGCPKPEICESNETLNFIAKQIVDNSLLRESSLHFEIIGYIWNIEADTPPTSILNVYQSFMAGSRAFQKSRITIHCDITPYVNIEKVLIAQKLYTYCRSSIWNYFYNGEIQCIKMILQEIELNICRYDLASAHEYKKFSYRKRKNAYIDQISTNYDAEGHGSDVVPFIFHSEEDIWKKHLQNSVEERFCWKVLLVDDHARVEDNKGLSLVSGSLRKPIGKKDIIIDNLARSKYGYGKYPKSFIVPSFEFDYVVSIDETLNRLKDGYRYDIILLDYKLKGTKIHTENNEVSREKDGNVIIESAEFGTDILKKIKESMEKQTNVLFPSPAGEYNFMFISAYPTAVQEEMMAEGLYSDTSYWFVRRGACPINTPWLFLFELNRMMERRIGKLSKHKEMVTRNDKFKDVKNLLQSPTALAFIEWLYTPIDAGDYQDIRSRCKNAFNAFLTLRSTYDKIKYDVYDGKEHFDKKDNLNHKFVDKKEKESSLIRSMFPDVVCYGNTFWEHMQHLVYLTAYGTNRQWPEMWEEMLSVSDILNKAEKEIDDANDKMRAEDVENKSDQNQASVQQTAVKLIRNYILNLKYQNSR